MPRLGPSFRFRKRGCCLEGVFAVGWWFLQSAILIPPLANPAHQDNQDNPGIRIRDPDPPVGADGCARGDGADGPQRGGQCGGVGDGGGRPPAGGPARGGPPLGHAGPRTPHNGCEARWRGVDGTDGPWGVYSLWWFGSTLSVRDSGPTTMSSAWWVRSVNGNPPTK